jgi:DNA-binding transcriptional LysR family regulator
VRIYRGTRSVDTEPGLEHQSSSREVVVVDGDGERQLVLPPLPDDYPLHLDNDFEWGYGGSGPLNLAAAILGDALGFVPSVAVVLDFCDSVVAEFPRMEFEFSSDVWQAWLDARLKRACEDARDVAGPQHL